MNFYYTPIAIVTFIISSILVAIIKTIRIVNKKSNDQKMNLYYEIAQGILIVYIIVALAYTLTPAPFGKRSVNLIPLKDNIRMIKYVGLMSYQFRTIAWNILLFIPFGLIGGLVLKLKNKSCTKIILYGLLFSIGIEVMQYITGMGRASDIDDVIFNLAGTLVGYLCSIFAIKIITKYYARS